MKKYERGVPIFECVTYCRDCENWDHDEEVSVTRTRSISLKKMLMYEIRCSYMYHKCRSKVKLSYVDTERFVYGIGTEDFDWINTKDVETAFDSSRHSKNYNRWLSIGKTKKILGIKKEKFGGKIMTEFVAFRGKLLHIKRWTKNWKISTKCV